MLDDEQVPVLEWLNRLTRVALQASQWNTLGRLRRLGNVSLRAWLLIEAARTREHIPV